MTNWYKKAQNSIKIMGEMMALFSSELIDGISYKLYKGEQKSVLHVYDTEAQETVMSKKYPTYEMALQDYNKFIQMATI